ncbi:MAG: metal-sensing transcriptional repressor [Bacilli bacterium]
MADSQQSPQSLYTVDDKDGLRCIEGLIGAVLSMMDQRRNCADVIAPLTAIHSLLDQLILHIVGASMEQCIRTELCTGDSAHDGVQENIRILMRSQ